MTVITPIDLGAARRAVPRQATSSHAFVHFNRRELNQILDVYGRMVVAGHWRDYSIEAQAAMASFSAYRRSSETPEIRIVKEPRLARRDATYRLVAQSGMVLRRGANLKTVLASLEKRLLRLVRS